MKQPPGLPFHINSLPFEVLSYIFTLLPYSQGSDHLPKPPWLNVLHVCRLWREIATHCCDFWRVIPLGHPKWTRTALRMSNPTPIDIIVPLYRKETAPRWLMDSLNIALSSMHRARMLDVRIGADMKQLSSVLTKISESRADNLLELTYHNEELGYAGSLNQTTFPRLRHLSLKYCRIPHEFAPFRAPLTALELSFCLTTPGFAATLASLSALEILILNRTRHFRFEREVNALAHLRFPRMCRLKIIDQYHIVVALMSRMEIPASASISLALDISSDVGDVEDNLKRLGRHLARHFRDAVDAGVCFDLVSHKQPIPVATSAAPHASCTVEAESWSSAPGLPPRYFSLKMEWETAKVRAPPLATFYATLPAVSGAATLGIGIPFGAAEWALLLAATPHAREVVFKTAACLAGCPLVAAAGGGDARLAAVDRIFFLEADFVGEQGEGLFALLLQLLAATPATLFIEFTDLSSFTAEQRERLVPFHSRVCF